MAGPKLVQIDLSPRKPAPKPEWLKARAPMGENYHSLKKLARGLSLHTVCESAQCPNIGECWNHHTATFMLLGEVCTRRCGFCAVPKGRPEAIDFDEPRRVAEAVERLGLKFAVVTSVNRDDDNLGGARVFAETIREIRRRVPECRVEVLIPDFQGTRGLSARGAGGPTRYSQSQHRDGATPLPRGAFGGALSAFAGTAAQSQADRSANGHQERSHDRYRRGLRRAIAGLSRLAACGVDILTVGQYLAPSRNHLPVKRMYTPQEFRLLRDEALKMGFRHVESGPLVRSSYHAHEQAESTRTR